MTAEQFLGWKDYADLEPFDETREDYRNANIVKALWDIARDRKKHPEPFPVEQFMLKFGEAEAVKPKQTWQQQKALAMSIVAAHNKGRRSNLRAA